MDVDAVIPAVESVPGFPATHIHVLSNFVGNGGFVFLSACPMCFSVCTPIEASVGRCNVCGYDVNRDIRNSTVKNNII